MSDTIYKKFEITEEEIKATYEANSDRYMLPEKVSIEYVELKSDVLSKDVEIDTQLMGGAAEKHIGAMAEGRAMRCLQLDAWMITK